MRPAGTSDKDADDADDAAAARDVHLGPARTFALGSGLGSALGSALGSEFLLLLLAAFSTK